VFEKLGVLRLRDVRLAAFDANSGVTGAEDSAPELLTCWFSSKTSADVGDLFESILGAPAL
jgi:hypothetical protein